MNTPTRRLLGTAAVIAVAVGSCSVLTREPGLAAPPAVAVPTSPGTTFVGTADGFTDWYGPGSMDEVGADEAGRPALAITAAPGGEQANARKALCPVADGSTSSYSFSVRTRDWSQVANVQLRLHTGDDSFFYANVKDRVSRTALVDDAWMPVQLSRADFATVGTPDWTRLDAVSFAVWGLEATGDSPATDPTVLLDDVLTHPEAAPSAPGAGVVSLTFDDGEATVADAARLMEPYGYRGSAFVIPALIGDQGHLDEADLDDLDDLGWDLGGHSDIPLTSLSPDELEANVEDTARWLQERGSQGGYLYAYPNGAVSPDVRRVVAEHFSIARTINENVQPAADVDAFGVRSLNVHADQDLDEVLALVDASVAAHDWLVLTFHRIGDEDDDLGWSDEKFTGLLDHLEAHGIEVQPMSEVLPAQ